MLIGAGVIGGAFSSVAVDLGSGLSIWFFPEQAARAHRIAIAAPGIGLVGMFFTKNRRRGGMMASTIIGALMALGAEDLTRAAFSGSAAFAATSLLFILAAERHVKKLPFVYAPEGRRLEPHAAMAVPPASASCAPRASPAADWPLLSRTWAVNEPVGDAAPPPCRDAGHALAVAIKSTVPARQLSRAASRAAAFAAIDEASFGGASARGAQRHL